jgi:hypothetical protein
MGDTVHMAMLAPYWVLLDRAPAVHMQVPRAWDMRPGLGYHMEHQVVAYTAFAAAAPTFAAEVPSTVCTGASYQSYQSRGAAFQA